MLVIILAEGQDGQNRTKQKINYIFLRQGISKPSMAKTSKRQISLFDTRRATNCQ